MEPISKALAKLQQPSSDSVSLTIRSGPPLPEGMGLHLAVMMAETQAGCPNQALPEGTPDMYLVQWERMALKYGMQEFRDGLSKAIRDSSFFPGPTDIESHCEAIAKARRMRGDALRFIAELDAAKAATSEEITPEERAQMDRLQQMLEQPRRVKGEPVVVKHEVFSRPLDTPGWVSQLCTCGKRWDSFGAVLVCEGEDHKSHVRALEQGLMDSKREKVSA